jgi:hypothetical protein
MTHPTYTQQALSRYNLPRLKRIAAELGIKPTLDKRGAETWVNAIINHQSTQLQKVADEQATAQSQAIDPEKLTTVEISFYDHEFYAGDKLIASITHDDNDFVTQRWVVVVNNKEVHRAASFMLCHRYICTHYKDGSLPVQEQNATDTPCTTGNEIMAQIFNECEKYGFEILDDGIYNNDIKLGEVGCTDGGWSVMRTGEYQQMPCDSAMDAVWWLSMVDNVPHEAVDCEELLDRPFDKLTPDEWQHLREYAPVAESRELVTA